MKSKSLYRDAGTPSVLNLLSSVSHPNKNSTSLSIGSGLILIILSKFWRLYQGIAPSTSLSQ